MDGIKQIEDRVEALERELRRRERAVVVGYIALAGVLSAMPDDALDLFLAGAAREAERNLEGGRITLEKIGSDPVVLANLVDLYEAALGDLRSYAAREKARRRKDEG